jgi:hypothetical protein
MTEPEACTASDASPSVCAALVVGGGCSPSMTDHAAGSSKPRTDAFVDADRAVVLSTNVASPGRGGPQLVAAAMAVKPSVTQHRDFALWSTLHLLRVISRRPAGPP